jgi:hypothetical protein
VTGELIGDKPTLASLHFAAQRDDRFICRAEAPGNGIEVIDPGGQDENVGALVRGG